MGRGEAIEILERGQARLDELMEGLHEEDLTRPATIGGGDWSAKDLIGHIAFWEDLALQTIVAAKAHSRSPAEDIFSRPGGVDQANAEDQERKRNWSQKRVRVDAEETHRRLLEAISSMGDVEWRSKVGEERRSLGEALGRVLGAPKRPFGHVFAHLPDLEAFVSSLR